MLRWIKEMHRGFWVKVFGGCTLNPASGATSRFGEDCPSPPQVLSPSEFRWKSEFFMWWVRVFFAESGLHIKIALSRNWTRLSVAEPIATVSCTFYHLAIVDCCILLTCAIYVTCGLIGKHIDLYSIWDIWYISWTSFSMWIQWRCPFCDGTNYI